MDSTSVLLDKSSAKSVTANPTVGQLEALGSDGQVRQSWRLVQPRCTIGSSAECLVCIDDNSMAAIHALIVFGKNHTLIRAMGGQVRIAGRSIREWLIDEPTMIQCGATRLVIYPTGYLPNDGNPGQRIAPGSIADQAARLRTASARVMPASNESSSVSIASIPDCISTQTGADLELPKNSNAPKLVLAKLDSNDVKTALEPLHRAVQAASDGIIELTRRANESANQFNELPSVNGNLSEISDAIELFGDRVSTITNYCENLLANVSESIDGRMNRLDELLSRLSETPSNVIPVDYTQADNVANQVSVPDVPASQTLPTDRSDVDAANDWSEDEIEADTNRNYASVAQRLLKSDDSEQESPTLLDDCENHQFDIDDREFQDETEQKEELALPSWFVESKSETIDDLEEELAAPVDFSPTSWSTAQLNPIYAEDSNRWLAEEDADLASPELSEDNAYSAENAYETPTAYENESELEPQLESSDESSYETPDYEETDCEETSYEPSYDSPLADASPSGYSDEEKEESIEEYMARLLQRAKGTSDIGERPPKVSTTKANLKNPDLPPVTVRENRNEADTEAADTNRLIESVAERKPSEFAPRPAAPEQSANLAAFRVLANDTVRQALQSSSRKKIEGVLFTKITIALLGLGGGVLLLVLNGLRANVAMIGTIASFIVCLLWGYEALTQVWQLRIAKAKEASEIAKS